MRITKKVFNDLAIFMIAFGVFIGVLFPIFTLVIGIPSEYITDYIFIVSCILAGLMVGLVNIILARSIVGRRLRILSSKMKYVNDNLQSETREDPEECLQRCLIPIDSEDEIGETADSFNKLVKSFLTTLRSESSLREFTEIFTNELDIKKLSDKALKHMIEFTGSSAGMIIIDQGGLLEVVSSHLIKNPESVTEMEVVHKSFSNNERVIFGFTEDVKIEAGLLDFYPKSILVEPISYKEEVLGLFLLASLQDISEIAPEDMNMYNHGLSLGMHNAIIHDKLQKLAVLDPLTKAYNRRFGTERLNDEFSRSIRTNNPLGVLMFDLDHFKNINDTYGHIVGDKVLINFAELIRANLRKGDTLVRYGGEEFLAILPGASAEGVLVVGEKIRRFTEENTIKHSSQDIKITVSIGGVSYPEVEIENVEDLVKKADDNLYNAKDTGRNKVVVR